jgi:RmlD substrate binding domain
MKIVILGDGLLGSELCKLTNWDQISRKKDNIDFCSPITYFDKIKNYDIVINCIGFVNAYSDDKEQHYLINYKGVVDLCDFCQSENKKLIQISTDYVYGCTRKSESKETDIPLFSPDWYSYYKLLADEYIMLKSNNYLICRCSFKKRPFPYDKAWIDLVGNFDYVDVISKLIIDLINKNSNGIFNVGTELKTIYELALKTNPNVKKCHKPDCVPDDTSMNIEKLKKELNI